MTKARYFFSAIVLVLLGLTTPMGRAQSIEQSLQFAVYAAYPLVVATNEISPGVTNYHTVLRDLSIDKNNVIKAIAVDLLGFPGWTQWAGAALVRRLNLATGAEAEFLVKGAAETNVSRFFTNGFNRNFAGYFTNGLPPAVTYLSNQFTNLTVASPIYWNWTTNTNGVLAGEVNAASASLHYFSLVTTNLVMNLVGADLAGGLNGHISVVPGVGTNTAIYDFPREDITVVGSVFVNITGIAFSTNPALNLSNAFFVSGPALGNVYVSPAIRSPVEAP